MVKFNPTEGCGEFLPGYGYPHDFTPPVSVGAPDPEDPPPVVYGCGFSTPPIFVFSDVGTTHKKITMTFNLEKTVPLFDLDLNTLYEDDPFALSAVNSIVNVAYLIVTNPAHPHITTASQISLSLDLGSYANSTDANCNPVIVYLQYPVPPTNPFPTVDLSGPNQEPIPPNPDGGFSAKFTVDIDPADLPQWELVPNDDQPPIVIIPPGGSYEEDIEVDVNFGPVEEDTQVSVVAVGKDNEGNIEVSSNTVTVTLDYVEPEPEEVSITVTANPNPVAVNENTDIEVTIVSGTVDRFEIDYGDGQSATQFVTDATAYTIAKTYNTTGTNTITVDAKAEVEGVLEIVKTEFVNVTVSSSPADTPTGTISYELGGVPFEVGSEVTFVAGSEPTFIASIVNEVNGAKYFWFVDGTPDIDQVNQDYTYKFIDVGTYTLDLKYVPSQSVFLDLDSVTITITLD